MPHHTDRNINVFWQFEWIDEVNTFSHNKFSIKIYSGIPCIEWLQYGSVHCEKNIRAPLLPLLQHPSQVYLRNNPRKHVPATAFPTLANHFLSKPPVHLFSHPLNHHRNNPNYFGQKLLNTLSNHYRATIFVEPDFRRQIHILGLWRATLLFFFQCTTSPRIMYAHILCIYIYLWTTSFHIKMVLNKIHITHSISLKGFYDKNGF